MERHRAAKLFHETVGRGIAEIRENLARHKLANLETGEYFLPYKPVYISQLAGAARSSISGFYGGIKDEKAARRFGTTNLSEFSYWAWRSCGIAGLQMVLTTELGDRFQKTTIDLVREGLKLDGYDIQLDVGWYHKSLVKLAKAYGIQGRTKKFIPSSEIALEIWEGNYVLASIRSERGGHLLLLYGIKISKNRSLEGFYVHDPSNFLRDGEARFISKEEFDGLSTRRVMMFGSKRKEETK